MFRAPRTPRMAAAVLMTVVSIAIAEVSIGSAPWGLVNPLQWILLVPIYGAQALLVASIVLRRQPRPTLAALWSAGVVMGLYEFYITRVLWDQPWDANVNSQLVEWPALAVVAGFYHPLMSVIVPMLLTEQVIVREPTLPGMFPRWMLTPGRVRIWAGVVIAGVVAGGLYKPHGPIALPALGLTALAVWAVVRWARRAPRVESLADALPGRRGRIVAWLLVALVFAPFVALAQTGEDRVPAERQVAALVLYAVFVALAWANLRQTRRTSPVTMPRDHRWWTVRTAALVTIALVAVAVPFTEVVSLLVVWGGGAVVAVVLLVAALRGAMRSRPALPATVAPRRDRRSRS